MSSNEKLLDIAARHWSKISSSSSQLRRRWWQSPSILRHINKLVCGEPLDGFGAGLKKIVKQKLSGQKLNHGISVGCGNGAKEMILIEQGIVEKFDLFEISEIRVLQGKELAVKKGLEENVVFYNVNAFNLDLKNNYDLVYWDNSLHHMLDVEEAVKWSYERLRPSGLFLMDDFIGPSRFQWSDLNIRIATRIREILPEAYLKNPSDMTKFLPRKICRPDLKRFIEIDPTEAADSDRIIPSIMKFFPDAEVKFTGGCIYHLALNDILANIDEEKDKALLGFILLIDEILSFNGENQYAVCIAWK